MLKKLCTFAIALVFVLGITTGCGGNEAAEKPEATEAEQASEPIEMVTDEYAGLMTDTDEIYSYVEDLANLPGMRQPGTEGGMAAQQYIMDKYNEFGLENVHLIPTKTDLWQCDDWSLSVQGKEIDSYRMYMSLFDCKYAEGGDLKTDKDGNATKENGTYGTFSTSDEGNIEDAEIIVVKNLKALKKMDPKKVEGKIVAANVKSLYSEPLEYYYAQGMGAVGFIGILADYFDSNKYNPEDMTYVNGSFKIPGYYVTKKAGDEIKTLVAEAEEAGEIPQAHFTMTVNVERTDKAGSVAGILPAKEGSDGKMIMVSSHYDATTPEGATQDGSGCSEVLALAKFFSQIPQENRDRAILFVLNDTHVSDYDAHDEVAAEYLGGEWYPDEGCVVPGIKDTDVLVDVSVEHIAEEAIVEDNELVMTGNVCARVAYVNDQPDMVNIVTQATENIQSEKETGVTEVTPIKKDDAIVTDADLFWYDGYGIPVVSLISGQIYLYDDCDTLDKIPQRALKPIEESLANIVWNFMKLDADAFVIAE